MPNHDHPLLTYRELINELKQLLSERACGVMFITTEDHHAIHIGVEKGDIIGCRYRFKRGLDSLPLIMSMEAGRYSFNPVTLSEPDTSLPPTEELIEILLEGVEIKPADTSIQVKNEIKDLPSLITKELAQYLGPMASLIVEDYLDDVESIQDNASIINMINSVSSEISDHSKREKFTESILSKI